jgi:hypothetical protein
MRYSATRMLSVLLLTLMTSIILKYLVRSKSLLRVWSKEKQKILINKTSNNDSLYVSKPPKFEGKQGSTYVIWSIKFTWAGVKRARATLAPSFDSRLPATEEAVLDDTDPTQKAQGKAILQKCYRLGVAHISMLKALEIRNFSF